MLLLATILMLLCSGIDQTEEEKFKRQHMDPVEGQAFLLVSKKFPRAKLQDIDSGENLVFSTGDPDVKNMFVFLKDEFSGLWTIRTARDNDRLRCHYFGWLKKSAAGSSVEEDQLWEFSDKDSDGFYEISTKSDGAKGWRLAMWDETGSSGQANGCYPHRSACNLSTGCGHRGLGLMDGDCDHNSNCWADMTCGTNNCKFSGSVDSDDCCIKSGHSNEEWIGTKWRLEDIFVSEAAWKEVAKIKNDKDYDFEFEIDQSHGYTKSFKESAAHTHSVTKSLKVSAGFSFKKLDLGADTEKSVTDDYSQAVESAAQEQYTVTQKIKVPVKAGDCVQVVQIRCNQDDKMMGVSDMQFTSFNTWVRDCPGNSRGANTPIPMDSYKKQFAEESTESVCAE